MNFISTIKLIIKGDNIDSLNKKIAELENNLKRTEDDNAKKIVEIERLKEKTETINDDLTREQNKVSIAENKQMEFALRLSESEKKIASLKTQNETLLETQKSLSEYNESLKAEIISKDNKITNLQEEKDQLSETITKFQEESSVFILSSS